MKQFLFLLFVVITIITAILYIVGCFNINIPIIYLFTGTVLQFIIGTYLLIKYGYFKK